LNTDDVHDAREIVGEHVQCHLGRYPRQALHKEVRCAHPHLQRREGVLDRLATLAHGLRIGIETLLHGFEHVLVFSSLDAPLICLRTLRFEWTVAAATRVGWVAKCAFLW
jgi:hypothetical protein